MYRGCMALNIKNPRVQELARRAAEATGRTQVSVMEEALERFLAGATQVRTADANDRARTLIAQLQAEFGPEDLAGAHADLADLYDSDGLPR